MAYLDKSPDEARARQAKKEDRRETAAVARAQAMYEKLLKQGKITPANREKMKNKIANKTGAYPMGGNE